MHERSTCPPNLISGQECFNRLDIRCRTWVEGLVQLHQHIPVLVQEALGLLDGFPCGSGRGFYKTKAADNIKVVVAVHK
jgi:hypothetical protein